MPLALNKYYIQVDGANVYPYNKLEETMRKHVNVQNRKKMFT